MDGYDDFTGFGVCMKIAKGASSEIDAPKGVQTMVLFNYPI